jgi:hypothetical protein
MSESSWLGSATPIVFLRPIGIRASDALRLLELAKRLPMPVRWRLAPVGVAADVYLAHRFCLVPPSEAVTLPVGSHASGWAASTGQTDDALSGTVSHAKISVDEQGYYRARPVCVLGRDVDTSDLQDDELAPLVFPDALREMERGLYTVLDELVGTRMLFTVGALAWEQRSRWPTHRLHATEGGQLIGLVDGHAWQVYLRDGCTVERMANADLVPRPRSGGFAADGFHGVKLEAALWEFAKRCPEESLMDMLPPAFLAEPLTHRRTPHIKEHALGDHCVAILRALDVASRSADELQTGLRLTRASLLRALTCLALVRAIQPESNVSSGVARRIGHLWRRLFGRAVATGALRHQTHAMRELSFQKR